MVKKEKFDFALRVSFQEKNPVKDFFCAENKFVIDFARNILAFNLALVSFIAFVFLVWLSFSNVIFFVPAFICLLVSLYIFWNDYKFYLLKKDFEENGIF